MVPKAARVEKPKLPMVDSLYPRLVVEVVRRE
jgi:hypothetical protein